MNKPTRLEKDININLMLFFQLNLNSTVKKHVWNKQMTENIWTSVWGSPEITSFAKKKKLK